MDESYVDDNDFAGVLATMYSLLGPSVAACSEGCCEVCHKLRARILDDLRVVFGIEGEEKPYPAPEKEFSVSELEAAKARLEQTIREAEHDECSDACDGCSYELGEALREFEYADNPSNVEVTRTHKEPPRDANLFIITTSGCAGVLCGKDLWDVEGIRRYVRRLRRDAEFVQDVSVDTTSNRNAVSLLITPKPGVKPEVVCERAADIMERFVEESNKE